MEQKGGLETAKNHDARFGASIRSVCAAGSARVKLTRPVEHRHRRHRAGLGITCRLQQHIADKERLARLLMALNERQNVELRALIAHNASVRCPLAYADEFDLGLSPALEGKAFIGGGKVVNQVAHAPFSAPSIIEVRHQKIFGTVAR